MATIIYDGECGLCLCTRRALEPLDVLRVFEWLPFQNPAAKRFGIPPDELAESVWLISGANRWAGFAAVKRILLRLPALYAVAALACVRYPKLALALAGLFSPVFNPVGVRLYHWVSHNRHRVPLSMCGVSPAIHGR